MPYISSDHWKMARKLAHNSLPSWVGGCNVTTVKSTFPAINALLAIAAGMRRGEARHEAQMNGGLTVTARMSKVLLLCRCSSETPSSQRFLFMNILLCTLFLCGEIFLKYDTSA